MKVLLVGLFTCSFLLAGQAQADLNVGVFLGQKRVQSELDEDHTPKQSAMGVTLEVPGKSFSLVASLFHSQSTHYVMRPPYAHKSTGSSQELSFGLRKYYGVFYAEAGPVIVFSSKEEKRTYDGVSYKTDADFESGTGYYISLGATHRFNEKISLQAQARFSDTFSEKNVATGHIFSLGVVRHF